MISLGSLIIDTAHIFSLTLCFHASHLLISIFFSSGHSHLIFLFPFIQFIILSLHDYSFNHYLTVLKGLPQAGTIVFSLNVLGEFVISSVLSRHSKRDRWASVTVQFYLACKGKDILKVWGVGQPKREEKRGLNLSWLPPFICFFLLALSLPYVNWASQEGYLFYVRFSLRSWPFLCSFFMGFFLSLSFQKQRHYFAN